MSSKINSLKQISHLGLNHHNYIVTNDIRIVDYYAKEYRYKFSIRTDKSGVYTKDLPFYLIDNEIEYFSSRYKIELLLLAGYTLILSDGHSYDGHLKYSIVMYIECNGDFIVEYSSMNVPLRHMYMYPDNLALITGNINDRYPDWYLHNTRITRIDVRLIRDKIYELFEIIRSRGLYGRYIELSVYTTNCGVKEEDTVYWEI